MPVHTGGDKTPYLVEDERYRDEDGGYQGQLEGGQEGRGHLGGDHAGPGRQQCPQGLGHESVDLVGEGEQADEYQQHRQQRAQEAVAQLGEVRYQRQGLVSRFRLAHAPFRSSCCAGAAVLVALLSDSSPSA